MESDETKPNPYRLDKIIRFGIVVHMALLGAIEGRPGGVLGGFLVGVLGGACCHLLLTRPTQFISWPLAFGVLGLGIGAVEGFAQGGADGALLLSFVGAVVSSIVGLSFGMVVCLVAKVYRQCRRDDAEQVAEADMTLDDVLESLAEECHADHVGLWEIVDAVRFDLGSTNALEIRALTLRLVRRLLSERGIQVGHPAPDGRRFVSWNLPPDQALSRIENAWSALGREPNIGEVAWFTSAQEPPNQPLQQTEPA